MLKPENFGRSSQTSTLQDSHTTFENLQSKNFLKNSGNAS